MVKAATKKPDGVPHNRKRYAEGSLTSGFAEVILREMARRGFSACELAERAGVSHRNVYRIINAEVSTSLETAQSVCNAVGIKLWQAIK